MLRVGITGGIGAGKSVVSKIFTVLGVPVYDADSQAKYLMNNDTKLKKEIKDNFGENAFIESGELNRTYLADKVFQNPDQLKKLNSLVHPVVKRDFDKWCEIKNSPYILKEAALLVESGSHKDLDMLLVVTAPEKLRIERVLLRDDHRTKKQVEGIISNQFPEAEKKKLADFLINNDESHPILSKVLEIHALITRKALKIS